MGWLLRLPRVLVWFYLASPAVAVYGSWWLWVGTVLALEAAFYAYLHRTRVRHQEIVSDVPPHDAEDSMAGFYHFAELAGWKEEDYREWVAAWFQLDLADFDAIRTGNVWEWLSWGLYSVEPDQLSDLERGLVRDTIAELSRRAGVCFPEGYTEGIDPMRHTFDPVRSQHYPLLVYAVLRLARLVTVGVLFVAGYRWKSYKGVRMMLRQGRSDLTPVVLLHGLGLGLINQMPLALSLLRDGGDRTLVVVETPEVAMLCHDRVPSLFHLVDAVRGLVTDRSGPLRASAAGKAIFMGHSYGSVQLAWLVKRAPEIVAGCVFVDPICFLLFLPGVSRNGVYLPSQHLSMVQNFIRREPMTAYTLSRHFWWYENNLAAAALPPGRCSVILSGQDSFCPVREVRDYLAHFPGVHVAWHDDLAHGDAMFERPARQSVVDAILMHARTVEGRPPSMTRAARSAQR